MKYQVIKNTIINRERVSVGDLVELENRDARLLVQTKRIVEYVEPVKKPKAKKGPARAS